MGYLHLNGKYNHSSVDLRSCMGVASAVHTTTIEGISSLIKRCVMGSYHKVSQKYLPLYVVEFQIRYNNSLNSNILGEAIRGC